MFAQQTRKRWAQYLREARQWRAEYPGHLPVRKLVHWYRPWADALIQGSESLVDEQPWMSFAAADFLSNYLQPHHRVFEWGTGGSTPFLARRVEQVVSVEHDAEWYARVSARMAELELNGWTGHLVPGQPSPITPARDASCWHHYGTNSPPLRDYCFRNYVERIEVFDDFAFDLVVVDGRARPACFAHGLNKVRLGGYILWDDSNRSYYASAMKLATAAFVPADLPGPRPYTDFFTLATIWKRVSNQRIDLSALSHHARAA